MRALWEWAVATAWAGWTLPALGALVGAALGARLGRLAGRRALRRRFVRFFEGALDDVATAPLGSVVAVRGVLVADEGASVEALDDRRPVALASAVVDGEDGALLAHERARGLALRTRAGAIPLTGAVRVVWGAPERAARAPGSLRERLGEIVDELGDAKVALRALPAGTEVVALGVLELRGPEGASYRGEGAARVIAADAGGTTDVVPLRPAPRPASARLGALALAPVLAFAASIAPDLLPASETPFSEPGHFEVGLRDAALMLTPFWPSSAYSLQRELYGVPLDAPSLRAQLLVEQRIGGPAYAAEVALARGALDEALALAERGQGERAQAARVATLRAMGRFGDAGDALAPEWMRRRQHARLAAEAGDVEAAARVLEGEPELRCGALGIRAARRDPEVLRQLYAHASERVCDRALAIALVYAEGSTEMALRFDAYAPSALAALHGADDARVRARLGWRRRDVVETTLDPPRTCDAFCRRAAERVLAGEGNAPLAILARAALDRGVATGDLATLDRLAAALEPFEPAEVARARVAAALIWRPDQAAAAIVAFAPHARGDELEHARAMLAARAGDLAGILELPRHQACAYIRCGMARAARERWRAVVRDDGRAAAAGLPDLGGLLFATSVLERGRDELVELVRNTSPYVALDTPIAHLHATLLVQRGVARLAGDEAWSAELDARIARFDELLEREDYAIFVELVGER